MREQTRRRQRRAQVVGCLPHSSQWRWTSASQGPKHPLPAFINKVLLAQAHPVTPASLVVTSIRLPELSRFDRNHVAHKLKVSTAGPFQAACWPQSWNVLVRQNILQCGEYCPWCLWAVAVRRTTPEEPDPDFLLGPARASVSTHQWSPLVTPGVRTALQPFRSCDPRPASDSALGSCKGVWSPAEQRWACSFLQRARVLTLGNEGWRQLELEHWFC